MYEDLYREVDRLAEKFAAVGAKNLEGLASATPAANVSLNESPLPLDVVLGYALKCSKDLPEELNSKIDRVLSEMEMESPLHGSLGKSELIWAFDSYSVSEEYTKEQLGYLAGIREMCRKNS
ncbi:MAG: hypothetical protein OEL87_00470 [Nanoarchaeota archaeon]|nr:hypothetical protein [Nanoarchaeota archaeon]